MPRPRPPREDKVTFLRSPYEEGQRLDIPYKLKYSNIIDPASLPQCATQGDSERPKPDPEVFEIPESHWPPENAEIVPSYMSADEIWNSCRRGTRSRFKTDSLKKKDESSESEKDESDSSDNVTSSVSYSVEIEGALRKLERLPTMCREDAIKDMKPDFSEQDYKIIQSASHQRFRNYIDMLKNTYGERDVGEPPVTEDPRALTRELKHRVENQTNNSDQNAPSTSRGRTRHRKQRFPLRAVVDKIE